MKRLLLVIPTLVQLLLCTTAAHCPPTPTPVPNNIYADARFVIQGAQIALTAAEAAFNLWCGAVDQAKCTATRLEFDKVKYAVADGLQLVKIAIDVAEEQRAGFNLATLLAQAETAWEELLKFLADLGVPPPSTQPKKLGKTMSFHDRVLKLPKTLLPIKKK